VDVVAGVTDMVGVGTGESLGDEGRDVVDSGTKELAGLCKVVAGWAGPITCSKHQENVMSLEPLIALDFA
jgi:hypothetical protein